MRLANAHFVWKAQYNAWILHNGNHCTPKRAAVNWNAQLIWKSRAELDYQWNMLAEDCVPDAFTSLLDEIKARVTKLKKVAKGKQAPNEMTAQSRIEH